MYHYRLHSNSYRKVKYYGKPGTKEELWSVSWGAALGTFYGLREDGTCAFYRVGGPNDTGNTLSGNAWGKVWGKACSTSVPCIGGVEWSSTCPTP